MASDLDIQCAWLAGIFEGEQQVDPEERRRKGREYYWKNRDHLRAKQREYYAKKREVVLNGKLYRA